jgi:hypothetical protein
MCNGQSENLSMVHLHQKHLKADVYGYPLVPLAQADSFNPEAIK